MRLNLLKRAPVVLACAAVLSFCFAATGRAQVVSGTIVGTVTDASGAVVPGATVVITNTGTNVSRTAKTNASGNYSIPLLQVGTYKVNIKAPGFKGFLASGLELSASQVLRVNAKLQLGQVSTTVTVSGVALPSLQTDTSSIGSTLVPSQVSNLPINNRNIIDLVRTSPGINEGAPEGLGSGTRPDDRRQTSEISANGQPEQVNNILIDGVDDNERTIGSVLVKPGIDAIQEVKVYTNLYTAKYGKTAGAVVNYITKSGTNRFHGSLFEFVRNNIFNAKDYFNVPVANNPVAGKKPEFRQNQFGGSLGGPIRKNKTFFFGDLEFHRLVQGLTSVYPSPSPCELGVVSCGGYKGLGNFSDLYPSTVIYNPVTHQPFDYNGIPNVIPPSEIDPISANYSALIPATHLACPSGPLSCIYTGAPKRTQNESLADIKINEHINTDNSIYARYSWNNTITVTPGALPVTKVAGIEVQPGGNPNGYSFPGPAKERQQNIVLNWTHILSPNFVMQLTSSYQRSTIDSLPLNFGVNVNTAFGGPPVNVAKYPSSSGLATVDVAGYGAGGGGGIANTFGDSQYIPIYYVDNVYEYTGQGTWTHGNQTITFGLGLIRLQDMVGQSPSPKGLFQFSGLLTNSTEGTSTGVGGNSYAQFLTGYSDNMSRNLSLVQSNLRSWQPSAYLEDDWHALPWLTLNLGLRYDIMTPFTERNDFMSNFDPTVPSVLNGGQMIIAGYGGYSRTAGIVTDMKEFQPRFGFAASLPDNMVVRGGFGLTFFPTNYFAGATLRQQPFTSVTTILAQYGQASGYTPPYFGESLGPAVATSRCLTNACYQAATHNASATLPGTTSAGGEAFNYNNAYAYQYSLQIQKAFWHSTATIGYVGSIDRRLRATGNLDAPLPPAGPGGCGGKYLTVRMTLPNPCQPYYTQLPITTSVGTATSNGVSTYNGLQTDFRHTGTHGLTFDTNFVYGRALTDVGLSAGGAAGGLYGNIPTNHLYDYGNSQLDMRYRWTLTLNYDLPFGKSMSGFAGQLAKGWSVSTLSLWSSGLPFTVTNANPQINNGSSSDRPNMIGSLTVSNPTVQQWFNIDAFRAQPFGTAGNEANNQIYGPSSATVGFSVKKNFPIREEMHLQFRASAYNLLNHPNFAAPNATIHAFGTNGAPTTAGHFGQVLSTNGSFPPREFEFGMRLVF